MQALDSSRFWNPACSIFWTFEMKQTHRMTSWWLAQCEGVAGDASRGAGPKASSSGAGPNVSELPMHTVLVASFLPEYTKLAICGHVFDIFGCCFRHLLTRD
jgi:hypothetical protein